MEDQATLAASKHLPVLVRLAFLVGTLLSCGTGLIAYVFCWVAIPKEGSSRSAGKGLLVALVCLFLLLPVALGMVGMVGLLATGAVPIPLHFSSHLHIAPHPVVARVLPGGQAEALGILPGDRIERYGGAEVKNPEHLQDLIREAEGEQDDLEIWIRHKDAPASLKLLAKPGPLGIECKTEVEWESEKSWKIH